MIDMNDYMPFVAAFIAGVIWEQANTAKHPVLRAILRGGAFLWGALCFGLFMLTHAELTNP